MSRRRPHFDAMWILIALAVVVIVVLLVGWVLVDNGWSFS